MKNQWFDVDKEGLSKILARRGGKIFIIYEMVQNSWDEDVSYVKISLEPIKNKPFCKLKVEDDSPEGFRTLRDAYTLFAESYKKNNPKKAGRFNLGEKLVLACCNDATITTTKGTIKFLPNGERKQLKTKREAGTVFEATVRMTRDEYEDICGQINLLIPPSGIETIFNGRPIERRDPTTSFSSPLPTEISNEEGQLRSTVRVTDISVYEPKENEVAMLYEKGIPVVDTGDRFHVDIQQKVPLPLDRDNVRPSYLRELRVKVLNQTYHLLSQDDSGKEWVNNALEDSRIEPEVIKEIIKLKFGKKVVAYDPSDVEGSKIAVSKGYTVVPGRTFNTRQWENIRNSDSILPAGKVTPSPKPYSKDGKPLEIITEDDLTDGMKIIREYAKMLSIEILGNALSVNFTNRATWPFAATYGKTMLGGDLVFNIGRLGHKFFDEFPTNIEKVDSLIIHEFGHHYSSDHLSSLYYDALCKIGAKMKNLALTKPEVLKNIRGFHFSTEFAQ